MNYGYAPLEPAPALQLEAPDEPDRLCIQLYQHALGAVVLREKDVLEVGSGRGGGASYVSRYLRPLSVTGLDFSQQAVDLCNRHRKAPGLAFTCGDAQAMPFPDSSFDAVLNIESSHCYPSMGKFLAEVHRVLRLGGSFLFADLRSCDGLGTLHRQFEASPLTLEREDDITANVLTALRVDNDRKLQLIQNLIPWPFRRPFRAFAGIEGTTNYVGFENGKLRYVSAHLTKRG
jgi:SAM-dependent methyltransferase